RRNDGELRAFRSELHRRALSRSVWIRWRSASVARAIDELVFLQPRHQAAQLRADFLDRMMLAFLLQLAEVWQPALVFGDPLVGELARLDLREDLLHRLARL